MRINEIPVLLKKFRVFDANGHFLSKDRRVRGECRNQWSEVLVGALAKERRQFCGSGMSSWLIGDQRLRSLIGSFRTGKIFRCVQASNLCRSCPGPRRLQVTTLIRQWRQRIAMSQEYLGDRVGSTSRKQNAAFV